MIDPIARPVNRVLDAAARRRLLAAAVLLFAAAAVLFAWRPAYMLLVAAAYAAFLVGAAWQRARVLELREDLAAAHRQLRQLRHERNQLRAVIGERDGSSGGEVR